VCYRIYLSSCAEPIQFIYPTLDLAMPNGTVGDHPLTDILLHKVGVYGHEADETIRKISELCSRRELEEWWDREIAWSSDTDLVLAKAKSRLAELLRRAKESGWEVRE